jgi:hypothetical protein
MLRHVARKNLSTFFKNLFPLSSQRIQIFLCYVDLFYHGTRCYILKTVMFIITTVRTLSVENIFFAFITCTIGTTHVSCSSHSSWFGTINNTLWTVQNWWSTTLCSFIQCLVNESYVTLCLNMRQNFLFSLKLDIYYPLNHFVALPSFTYLLTLGVEGFLFSLGHTQTHITFGRTPLDEGSARRRDLYLTTQTLYKRQTSMPPVRFEPTIPSSVRPQTYALDRAATGIGHYSLNARYSFRSRHCRYNYSAVTVSSTVKYNLKSLTACYFLFDPILREY